MKLCKFLTLPSPVDLGWSDTNSLGLRDFTDDPTIKTWEEYNETVKKMFPIRAFLVMTLPDFMRYQIWLPLWLPFERMINWLKCHILPSHKYHMLDLRQNTDGIDEYRFGWADIPERMMFAMFNLLKAYLDQEPFDFTTKYSKEEINADAGMKQQQDQLEEAQTLYHWWSVERKQEYQEFLKVQDLWWQAHKQKDPIKTQYWSQMSQMRGALEEKTDQMLVRILKIRRGLWT